MSQRIPTIREIAEACGCNNSTVSRALNQNAKISQATRDRILEKATEMGWKPNPLASAYMAHRRSTQQAAYRATLAYIDIESKLKVDAPHDSFHLHYEGAKECAAKYGYTLETFSLSDHPQDGRQLSRMLKARGIPGVVLASGKLPNPDALSAFEWNDFSCSISGHTVELPFHRSAYYWPSGINIAVHKIREYGYKHVALITSEEFDDRTHYGITSTFFHYEKYHRRGERFQSLMVPKTTQNISDCIGKWLQKKRPEVVISLGYTWKAIQQMQWKIPEDIAFVSPHWASNWPQVAGINQNANRIGCNAVELVVSQINANERGPATSPSMLMNEGFWVDGNSLPDRRRG